MSGHSKWSTIKRQKGAVDVKRGNVFTKLSNTIVLAAKLGGSGDPESNSRLRLAIELARSANMPKENIQRAIDRGLGKLTGQNIEEVNYEGFGPAKAAFYVEGVTDNKMRTTQEIKNLFERSGGSLGGQGSTVYMFDRKGEIRVKSKGGSVESEIFNLIDLGAEDVEDFEEGGQRKYLIHIDSLELNTMSTKVTQAGFEVETSEIVYKPNMVTQITDADTAKKVLEFAQRLEDHDSVQRVYANFDISDGLI